MVAMVNRARSALVIYLIIWVVAIGCIPVDGMAMLAPADISGTASETNERVSDLEQIQVQLESKVVSQRLSDLGLTPVEVQKRMASLSNEQIHQVAQNLEGLQAGGELILILAIIGAIVVVLALIGLARQA